MKKTVLFFAVSLMVVGLLPPMLVSLVQAQPLIVTDKGSYIEYVGSLDHANFVVRFPDPIENWNGMLIIGCHGYANYTLWDPDYQFNADKFKDTAGNSIVMKFINDGFAYAASSYGECGYCLQKGMIRTHQLTEYVIDNYQVTGKIFLLGFSMGGTIALLLGEKYPNLYSGVLDVCGGKDLTERYYYIQTYTPPGNLQTFFTQWEIDICDACGGTPEEKPQFYERFSPTSNANIHIPVVSVHGSADILLPPVQALSYGVAVAQAGCSQYHHEYMVAGGTHCGATINSVAYARFSELVSYPEGW